MKILKPLAVMPENHYDYPAARLVFMIYGRLRKLANEAAKEHVKHDHFKDRPSSFLNAEKATVHAVVFAFIVCRFRPDFSQSCDSVDVLEV
jgi:hypothetical protein